MILRDIQDDEDYSQFREYLKLRGLTVFQSYDITDRLKTNLKRRSRKHQAIAYDVYNRYTTRSVQPGTLATIIQPESELLQGTPIFHRYIAYLLTFGNQYAADKLGIGRATLHRWLKRNKYLLKKTYRKSSTVWYDVELRKKFASVKSERSKSQ